MKLFKKIFDLEPESVESFIRNKIKNHMLMDNIYLGIENNCKFIINWCVTVNEFYVYLEPDLKTNDWKTFSFRGNNDVSLHEYFDIIRNHWHFTFQEIYGEMTGETVLVEDVFNTEYDKMLLFMYNKERVTVGLKGNEWCMLDWDFEKDVEIKKPVPDDLMKHLLGTLNN